jgi:outer membrane protein assembly factor BamE (lipoprotein component of BamABCDE complex)
MMRHHETPCTTNPLARRRRAAQLRLCLQDEHSAGQLPGRRLVSQLKEGMTRSQVRFLLGTPMVPDAFNEDRWDYFYFFNSQKIKQPLKRRLTVFFADDKVQRFENLGVPVKADLEQLERDLRKAVAATKPRKRSVAAHVRSRQGEGSQAGRCGYFGEDPRSGATFRARARARRDSFGSAVSGR